MRRNFAGGRIIKTGIAIFLTAFVCEWIGLSPVFAVITAIVTIEPTISDSIRKGMVRFPASAIGAAFAVTFIALFGNSPITYALAAVLTIAACYKLNLHDGLLVATITSVAMIDVTTSSFLLTFFIRLGTTSIGLFVSTVVNMLIFPPRYRIDISANISRLANQTADILQVSMEDILGGISKISNKNKVQLKELHGKVSKTEQFIRFERDEMKYRFIRKESKRGIIQATKQKDALRRVLNHIDHLRHVTLLEYTWTSEEQEIVLQAVNHITALLKDKNASQPKELQDVKKQLTALFLKGNDSLVTHSTQHSTFFSADLIILYELLSIIDETEAYVKATLTSY